MIGLLMSRQATASLGSIGAPVTLVRFLAGVGSQVLAKMVLLGEGSLASVPGTLERLNPQVGLVMANQAKLFSGCVITIGHDTLVNLRGGATVMS